MAHRSSEILAGRIVNPVAEALKWCIKVRKKYLQKFSTFLLFAKSTYFPFFFYFLTASYHSPGPRNRKVVGAVILVTNFCEIEVK